MTNIKTNKNMSLFQTKNATKPLADAIRPSCFEQVFGQQHLLGLNSPLVRMLNSSHFTNIILWGPPGCGKTTIAKIIAKQSGLHFHSISAVMSSTAELREILRQAKERKQSSGTLLLVDEIHHFNRTQQDIFLPYLENGTIILVGATTENPSFELNSALLSRCKVLALNRLDLQALEEIITRVENISNRPLPITVDARVMLCNMSDGDGRYLLNMCEELLSINTSKQFSARELLLLLQKRMPLYDKSQEGHHNLISALHKSLRGSDSDAGVYWLQRMLDGGENPLYIIRRLVRFATEDIGLADPQALVQALAAKDAYEFLGLPEGELAIIQAVLYLATSPKSNATYIAHKTAKVDAQKYGSLPPPKHVLNAPTSMMKKQGYGVGYQYDHDVATGFSGQNYFPEKMTRKKYYHPVERGFEREIRKRLYYFDKLREKKIDN